MSKQVFVNNIVFINACLFERTGHIHALEIPFLVQDSNNINLTQTLRWKIKFLKSARSVH